MVQIHESNFKTLSKVDVGLGNVDNTADINKNVLTATKLNSAKTFAPNW